MQSEHRDSFATGPGWAWNVQSRGKHAGAFDIDECDNNSCVECALRGSGRHKADLAAYTRFYA